MTKETDRPAGLRRVVLAASWVVIGLALSPSAARSQNTVMTPGGTIGKVPKWTGTSTLVGLGRIHPAE